jgi:hypothetical protein
MLENEENLEKGLENPGEICWSPCVANYRYLMRHLDVIGPDSTADHGACFRRSMELRLLDAGSTQRNGSTRCFRRFLARKRIRAVAICVGVLRKDEMVLVGRKLASDFSDR